MMKESIFLLLGVIVISGFISMLAPETSLKRYLSLLTAICLLFAMLEPIGELVGSLESIELGNLHTETENKDYESVYKETLISGNEESFCRLLKAKMSRELGIEAEHFDIRADMRISAGEYKLESLSVILCGMGITQDPKQLKDYTSELFGIECEIIYG